MKRLSIFNIIIIAFSLISTTQVIYADSLNRIRCPYCGENTINILDEEYGVCQCESCEELLLIIDGRAELADGRKLQLKDLYDIDALIEAIENGEFDVYEDEDSNNYREYLQEEDDGGEESYFEENDEDSDTFDANDDYNSSNPAYKSSLENIKTYLYSKDFKNHEPESDEEFYAYLEKLNNKKKKKKATQSNISSPSNVLKATVSVVSSPSNVLKTTQDIPVKKNITIPHVIKYYASVESELYITEVVMNGVEFRLRDVAPIEGFKFLGWSPNKNATKLFKENSLLTLYNFNLDSVPSARVYNFYAIWEKEDETNE